jgi:hypothetical protein
MSIKQETISYSEVVNHTLLNIFGGEMTYNELRLYAKYPDESTHLQVKTFTDPENDTQIVTVFFDGKEVMEKEYPLNHSCDMFYLLQELEQQCEHCGDCFEQGRMCEHGSCPDCRQLCVVCSEEEEEEEVQV